MSISIKGQGEGVKTIHRRPQDHVGRFLLTSAAIWRIRDRYQTGLGGRMPKIFRWDLVVTEDMIDGNGHVNNVEYLRWMQDAAKHHSESRGCARAMQAMGATWVVRAHRIEYLKPCFSGEHISVLTWIASFRRVKSLRKYRILRREDGALLVEAETDWIFMDRESGRLKSIPQEVVELFGMVPEGQEEEALAALS